MSIPEDVFEIVLHYLSFYDIVISFQPTCKLWWNTAQQTVINVNTNFQYSKKFTKMAQSPSFMQLIERRFPNVQILNVPSCYETYLLQTCPAACKNLKIITHNEYHSYHKCADGVDLHTTFPMYSGFFATQYRRPNEEEIQNVLQRIESKEITHLQIGPSDNHPKIVELFRRIFPKLANLTTLSVQSTEDSIKYLPTQMHVTRLSTNFLSVLQKCPNTESLELGEDDRLGIYSEAEKMQYKIPTVVELKTIRVSKSVLILFPNLKRLGNNIYRAHFPCIIENCPLLEEIHISKHTSSIGIQTLIDELPRLRYIFCERTPIQGFVEQRGVIDVKRTKEIIMEPVRKRAKLE